jgi:hypothetical protein
VEAVRYVCALALGLLLVVSPVGAPSAVAQGGEGDPADATARAQAAWLERRVQQAEGGEFYLVLDPSAETLALALGGVTLLELSTGDVTVETPRVLFRRAAPPPAWQDTAWLHGVLDPPLPVVAVVPPPDGDTEAAAVAPAMPEELVPAPDVYDVRFEGGLALRVVTADDGAPRSAGWTAAARERWQVWRGTAPDAVRVQVRLTREDAGRLYRALPPDVALLMAPRLDPSTPQEP